MHIEELAELELLAQEELDKQAGFKLRIPNIPKAIGDLAKATKGGTKIPPLSRLGARQESLNKTMNLPKMSPEKFQQAQKGIKDPKTLGQHVQDFLPFEFTKQSAEELAELELMAQAVLEKQALAGRLAAGGALVGGGIGAAVDKENRLRGALIGAGSGAALGGAAGLATQRGAQIDVPRIRTRFKVVERTPAEKTTRKIGLLERMAERSDPRAAAVIKKQIERLKRVGS